ncbi:hypothetical protein OH76DRAFT_256485 [Lentinus brumalis]|uniref:Uncharacterized protein n=1 Tax=Lentinus brumalis TaxID=2498619 RepID=A0A371CLA1_9APHY|nr:hypothetical protein OH76DRAFT_256485 [Polyporus brumalis]
MLVPRSGVVYCTRTLPRDADALRLERSHALRDVDTTVSRVTNDAVHLSINDDSLQLARSTSAMPFHGRTHACIGRVHVCFLCIANVRTELLASGRGPASSTTPRRTHPPCDKQRAGRGEGDTTCRVDYCDRDTGYGIWDTGYEIRDGTQSDIHPGEVQENNRIGRKPRSGSKTDNGAGHKEREGINIGHERTSTRTYTEGYIARLQASRLGLVGHSIENNKKYTESQEGQNERVGVWVAVRGCADAGGRVPGVRA